MNMKALSILAFAATTTAGYFPPASAQTFDVTTVMSRLNNPRGLTFGPDGSLYVAEAGVGAGTNTSGPSFVDGNGATVYYGLSSGVSRLKNGVQQRLISDLASAAGAGGAGAGGLTHLAFANGTAYGVINFGGNDSQRAALISAGVPNAQQLGTVVQLNFGTTPSSSFVTDVTGYAAANNLQGPTANPAHPGSLPESNPYGFTTLAKGGYAVADAGGDFVATIGSDGKVNNAIKLPDYANSGFKSHMGGPTSQAVPTSVTEGADGTLYVSELGGYPFAPGDAHIDVIKNGSLVSRFGGFTTLVDVVYYDGELYALEDTTNGLASNDPGPGSLLEINPLTGQQTVLYSGLLLPGGLAVEDANTFFISTGSVFPGGGSVIRLTAVPEPSTFAFLLSGCVGAGFALRRRRVNSK